MHDTAEHMQPSPELKVPVLILNLVRRAPGTTYAVPVPRALRRAAARKNGCSAFFRARKLSNSCSMAADDPTHVRACSTASTPACTVPDLLSLFEKYQKVPTGRHASKPPRNPRFVHTSGCTHPGSRSGKLPPLVLSHAIENQNSDFVMQGTSNRFREKLN